MMRFTLVAVPFVLCLGTSAMGQVTGTSAYEQVFSRIADALDQQRSIPTREVVFDIENAYFDGGLDSTAFNASVDAYAELAKAWCMNNHPTDYHARDSAQFALCGSAFHVMTDTVFLADHVPVSIPFTYDTADIFGITDWSKMFVTKLLATHTGNCHSMPLFYKMICEELGVKAYLAFAPNHLYIKQHSEKLGWYNTELTSRAFPTDAWIMASGYVSADALRSRIYMDTLGEEQTLAYCLVDLAQGYQAKYRNANPEFMLRCCQKTLQHFPNCIAALQLKAEMLGRELEETHSEALKSAYMDEVDITLGRLVDLGYRQVPPEVFRQWFAELHQEPEKYIDPRLER